VVFFFSTEIPGPPPPIYFSPLLSLTASLRSDGNSLVSFFQPLIAGRLGHCLSSDIFLSCAPCFNRLRFFFFPPIVNCSRAFPLLTPPILSESFLLNWSGLNSSGCKLLFLSFPPLPPDFFLFLGTGPFFCFKPSETLPLFPPPCPSSYFDWSCYLNVSAEQFLLGWTALPS